MQRCEIPPRERRLSCGFFTGRGDCKCLWSNPYSMMAILQLTKLCNQIIPMYTNYSYCTFIPARYLVCFWLAPDLSPALVWPTFGQVPCLSSPGSFCDDTNPMTEKQSTQEWCSMDMLLFLMHEWSCSFYVNQDFKNMYYHCAIILTICLSRQCIVLPNM